MNTIWQPKTALPLHALWADDLGWCNTTAWLCDAGFSPISIAGQSFCCPREIPDSQPSPDTVPCGITCKPGFFWDSTGYNCSACRPAQNLTPGNEWGLNCTMTFDCDRVFARPAGSFWPSIIAPGDAKKCVWQCVDGYVQNGANLCCSESVPGYGVAGRSWTSGDCSLQCNPGLFSSSLSGSCVPCAQYLKDTYGLDYCKRC